MNERDWFVVYEEGGERYVRYEGFAYVGEDDGDGEWRVVSVPGVRPIPLGEAARFFEKEYEGSEFDLAEKAFGLCALPQFAVDCTEDEVRETYATRFGLLGEGLPLKLSEVKSDTLCGCYWYEEV